MYMQKFITRLKCTYGEKGPVSKHLKLPFYEVKLLHALKFHYELPICIVQICSWL